METQAGLSVKKAPFFCWNDELVAKFVDLLVAHQLRYGKKQPFKWKEIADDFAGISGYPCTKEAMRNKFENIKSEFKAWMTLKPNETGIRWDPVTGRIDATDEWWEQKIKENVHCKKFRRKGMNPAYEDLLVRLFEGRVATGWLAFSPWMHPSCLKQRYAGRSPSAPLVDEQDCGERLGNNRLGGDDFFKNVNGVISQGQYEFEPNPRACQSQPAPFRGPLEVTPLQSGQNTRLAPKSRANGGSWPEEHWTHSRSDGDSFSSSSRSSSSSNSVLNKVLQLHPATYIEPQIRDVVNIVRDLVSSGHIEDSGEEFWFGTSLAAERQYRQVFLALGDPEHRVGWLRYEMQRRAQKRKR